MLLFRRVWLRFADYPALLKSFSWVLKSIKVLFLVFLQLLKVLIPHKRTSCWAFDSLIVFFRALHMREHPDYKYRPRRKPKPMMKKELNRYPFPFPFLHGLDPISRQLISSYSLANPERVKEPFSSPLDLSSFKLGQSEENYHFGMIMKSQSFLTNSTLSSFSSPPYSISSTLTSTSPLSSSSSLAASIASRASRFQDRLDVDEKDPLITNQLHRDSPSHPDSTTSPAPPSSPTFKTSIHSPPSSPPSSLPPSSSPPPSHLSQPPTSLSSFPPPPIPYYPPWYLHHLFPSYIFHPPPLIPLPSSPSHIPLSSPPSHIPLTSRPSHIPLSSPSHLSLPSPPSHLSLSSQTQHSLSSPSRHLSLSSPSHLLRPVPTLPRCVTDLSRFKACLPGEKFMNQWYIKLEKPAGSLRRHVLG